ncbi:UDP-glucose/GDP-mannose dehydrogenase family, central domain protein [Mycobacterium xenopi 3993]|nr:UDP-glucose/GDP-mannose dehydrogenase family, central domain protein [Mycobacterium xenopi 3993]
MPKGSHDVNILMPGVGVGGCCLTKDLWFVDQLGRSLGLDLAIPRTSRAVIDTMPAYTYELLEQLLANQGNIRSHLVSALLRCGDSAEFSTLPRTPETAGLTSAARPTSGSCAAMSLIRQRSKQRSCRESTPFSTWPQSWVSRTISTIPSVFSTST